MMIITFFILLYIKRDDIYIYMHPHHFTDTTASTSTRVSAKTVKDIKLKIKAVGLKEESMMILIIEK